ncbi:MAG: SDR family NAD(P)-dependent oxidoreductase [Solirubrobacteraceae bacterium]|nr:SDR family NAD(P)-dependent oxidoreductase [Patulibacter sp.]
MSFPSRNAVLGDRGLVAVTGCSSGIGQATAIALVDAGFRVLAGVRTLGDADPLASLGDRAEAIQLDVTNAEHVAAFGERVRSEPRGLAGLINNAGIISVGPVELVAQEKWEQVMNVNVLGTVAVTREAIPAILKAKGRIVNISSPSGKIALPMLGPYSVSKFGIEALSDTLRRELGHSGVRVISVSPGMVATPIFDKGVAEGAEFIDTNYDNPDLYERYAERAFSAIDAGRDALEKGSTPDVAAALILKAFTARRPKPRYGGGVENKAVGIITKLPDRVLDWIVAQIATTEPR